MKKIISIVFIITFMLGIFLISRDGAVAADNPARNNAENQAKIDNLRSRGIKEIDRRVRSLSILAVRVKTLQKLSADQKTQFATEIQQNVTDLTSLRTKINVDMDLATLKTDVKSVVDSYRIYAVFMPKIHILTATGSASQIATKLSTMSEKLNTRISEAEANGKDVANLKTLLADMNAKIKAGQDQIKSAEDKALSAVPSGFPESRSTLAESNKTLAEAKQSLVAAKQDASQIVAGLKKLK